jgi:glycosyltransferase involved in cell wall biosynthesis
VAALPHNEIFRILAERRLIAAHPAPQLLPQGNVDRRPEESRTSWRATGPDGAPLKLTLGQDLADLARRHKAFAQDCVALVPPLAFFESTPLGDALAEPFFDGVSVAEALRTGSPPVVDLRMALDRVETALNATAQPSDETARQDEWRSWTERLLALPVWTEHERQLLRERILPRLPALLDSSPPATRWSNGDFTPDNLLINSRGDIRLIDLEFAARTHFFREDAVRFPAFSPAVRVLPAPPLSGLPTPSLAWHLFFWLRQFHLEVAQNTPAYVDRMGAHRLGLIRRLAEQILECSLPEWRVPAPVLEHRLEETRWAPDQFLVLRLHGWVHAAGLRLESVAVYSDNGRITSIPLLPRSDVAQHFGEVGLHAGFQLSVPVGQAGTRLILAAVTADGIHLPFLILPTAGIPGRALQFEHYPAWAARHDPAPAPASVAVPAPVRFSVLLPVYNPPADVLRACLQSVRDQQHANWELVVVDDASTASHVAPMLREFAASEPRVMLQHLATNGGIARATNAALTAAHGDFIVLLDHDDLLRPHALAELARRLTAAPELDVLYSDEDKITADGRRLLPLFKPAYSPEFLLGVMYAGHVLCVRLTVARAAGGFLSEYDGIQDYEFLLRVSALTRRIGHVPRILYHWRQSPTSSALLGNVKGDMDARQLAAVRAQLARTGDPREAASRGGHRVKLIAGPATPAHDLVIAGAGGMSPLAALRQACAQGYAEIIVLLAAPPLEASPGWERELAAVASRPDAGCVAPILLEPDGRVRAAGWTIGPAGTAAPLLRGFHPDEDGYNGSLACNREVSVVSACCVAVRRDLAQAILERLDPSATWLDFCALIRAEGKYHRVCATARLRFDPIRIDDALEGTATEPDPFFNPHFDPHAADYSLAVNTSPASTTPLQFHLDQPATWDPLPRCLIVRGWAFAGAPIQAVRLLAGALTFSGTVGLPRPDVRAALPAVPDEFTGFEIRATLPAGRIEISIEVQLSDQSWHPLLNHHATVPRRLLPLWLGGGDWTELMFFQMPAHMAYPARSVRPEKFPAKSAGAARPRFAIVTPSYNQARFLPDTLSSVLEQPGVSCDYVVQDGGSTDDSAAIIRQQAGRLHAWSSEPDGGQAAAIARGFARTSGVPEDIMAWINSDDFYLPGTLAFVADYFATHPEVDVVYGHRIVVDEESREIARWFLPPHDPAVLRLNDFVPQETLFWRRRIWGKVGGIDPSFKFALDWDLLLRFQAAGAKIVRVPRFLACFRVHAAQKTSAQMHDVGQKEITLLRERTHGRPFPPQELERNPRLLSYLRRSAFIQSLWGLGIRAR